MKLTVTLSKKLENQLLSLIKETDKTKNYYVHLALKQFLEEHQQNIQRLVEVLTPEEIELILKKDK